MNTTDRYRALAWGLFTLTVIAALIGWLAFDRDPTPLAWIAGGPLVGETANVGKRATWKREATDYPQDRDER